MSDDHDASAPAPGPALTQPPPPPPPPLESDLDEHPPGEPQPIEPEHHRSFWRELPVLLVIAFVIALLVKSFVLQAFFIPSASMEPTLKVGDRVLVEKFSYRYSDIKRGQIVVFERDLHQVVGADPIEDERSLVTKVVDSFRGLFGFPTGTSQDFIKRVIGVGGDTVEGRGGKVFVNDRPVDESYLPEGTETSSFGPVDVPEGHIFVMGDNRGNSEDSRVFGGIPDDAVVGRAFMLIWPPSDAGRL